MLKDTNIDEDAKTRHQAKAIENLTVVKKAGKKPTLKKAGTMVRTAKVRYFFRIICIIS